MKTVAETRRLILREWADTEAEILHGIIGDPETMAHWPAPLTFRDAVDWIARSRALFRDHGLGRWAVCLKETGDIIGDCGLSPTLIDGAAMTDLGYIIRASDHRRGYAPEAAAAALSYGVRGLGLDNIVCHMADDHPASRKVAEKLGLRLNGGFHYQRNRGKWHLKFQP